MSKNFEPSSYDPTKDRTKHFEPRPQGFYASTQNPNQMLNYSFQTGEEFSLEFMQERAILRSQPLPKNNNANQIQPSPVMSSMAQRSQSSIPTHKMNNLTQSKEIGRTNVVSGFSEHEQGISSNKQGSIKKFLPSTLSYNFVQENIIKFFCNFGGKFLPRPSDGKIRYVGGETYILKLSKDITWEELVQKTMRLCNRTHTIKYQLPGESVHVLILVSCDEDVHHMIEECDVFEGGEEKPRLFLFSSEDEDGHSDVHFGMGSTDTDYEARFMAAVNGVSITRSMDMDRDPVNIKGSASGSLGDLDQLIFDLDSDSTSNANYSGGQDFTVPTKGVPNTKNYAGGITISTKRSPHKPIIQMASSVPAEFKLNNKSKHAHDQKELRQLDGGTMELNFNNKTTRNVDNKLFSRKLARQFSDKNLMPPRKVSSPRSSIEGTSFDDPFFRSDIVTSSFGYSKYEDDVNSLNYTNTNNMTDEPLPRPEDRSEPTNIAIYDSTGSTSLHGKMPENDDQFIETSGSVDGSAGLVQYNMIPLNKSFNKQRKFGSHEDTKLDLIYGERPSGNILRQHTIERSDPDDSMRSKELNLNDIMWQDDMGVSFHSNSLVRKLTKEEFPLKNLEFSQTKKQNSKNSRNKKEEFDLGSGSREERKKASFEMDPVHQVYHTPTNNRSNSGRSEGGSLRIGHLSQDDRDSVKIPLFEHEEFENEGEDEPSLQKIDLLSRNFDLSNVQVISNDDLEDLRELGSGAFGTVYHGKWRGTDVAIKRIKNSCFTQQSSQTYKLVQEFCREAGILSKLHHPNVLAFYGVVNDGPGGSLATVTEFMVSGSLKRVLLRRDRYLDQRKRIILAMDASIGMEYLHAKGVVHFDLKCDNLLVNLKDPSRPICKVADFGLAKMKETTMVSMVSGGMRGTLPWMAPEQLSHTTNKVSEKIDVYSFGVVMWEILTCDDPYDGMHYGQVILGILSNTLRPPIPSSCDPDWRNLMERCWSADPSDRPSFTEIASCLRVMLDACQTRATN